MGSPTRERTMGKAKEASLTGQKETTKEKPASAQLNMPKRSNKTKKKQKREIKDHKHLKAEYFIKGCECWGCF